jgi:hypothetical protein
LLCCWQCHLPAKLGSPTTTIVGRVTCLLMLCITMISPSIIVLLLYREKFQKWIYKSDNLPRVSDTWETD